MIATSQHRVRWRGEAPERVAALSINPIMMENPVSTNRYEEAKRIVREHEAACLAEFKAKLDALICEYLDTPRAGELAHQIRTQYFGEEMEAERRAAIREGLLSMRKAG
jgi:hypothetical protein